MRTPRHDPARRRMPEVALAALALCAGVLVASPAGAVPTCLFDGMTATVTVDVGNDETATIGRSGDSITLDGVPCDSATVLDTDAIVVNTAGIPAAIVIDLSGGDFAPGVTTESDGGNSEIEFTINLTAGSPIVRITGSSASDNIVAGAAGLNLNAIETAGDADVLIVGIASVIVEGGQGNDVLSVTGGSGTGAASTARLNGGPDGDLLLGAAGGNTIEGGDGVDTVNYSAATQLLDADLASGIIQHVSNQVDQLIGIENLSGSAGADVISGDIGDNVLQGGDGPDTISGGGGNDTLDGHTGIDVLDFTDSPNAVVVDLIERTATGDGTDDLSGFEDVVGSAFGDRLTGDAGANQLSGLDGDDRIEGADGDDVIDGGAGIDTAVFGLSEAGVAVRLGKGTATGAGSDTLANVENASGTDQADTLNGDAGPNVLMGGGGGDELKGREGPDLLQASRGNDLLFGQKGADDLEAGPGRDQLDGGEANDRCNGGADPDSFVFCETIRLG